MLKRPSKTIENQRHTARHDTPARNPGYQEEYLKTVSLMPLSPQLLSPHPRILPPHFSIMFQAIDNGSQPIDLSPKLSVFPYLGYFQILQLSLIVVSRCFFYRLSLLLPLPKIPFPVPEFVLEGNEIRVLLFAAKTGAVLVAETDVFLGADDVLAREDELPYVLPDASAETVFQTCVE